ncbi:MAG: outer membrane protein, partial [Methylocystis sp.]
QRNLLGIGLVLGLETDIQGIAGSSGLGNRPMTNLILTFSGHNQFSTYSSSSADSSLSYVGTARARIGFLIKPEVMIYGSGGFAYGQGSLSLSQFQQFGAAVGWSYSNTPSTLVGWSVGGGAEWMFLPNWSAKAEYIYYDLGNISTQN